ncbi:RNA-directed DNA polymerase [Rhodopseudomonas sp. BR0M22]|uniref:RNA-directed DNA polymerase n=1 Tax=Rhodopseudomonas sp. BR0M22 TaxID=2269369 RepID=UPI0013DE98B2|nr:RNA-directed DNA polymerase [Rhodopseudomonas sp. BR0M22]
MSDKIPFGLDGAVMAKIDWQLALTRIIHDLRSDFIYAPHIGFIYAKAGDELILEVKAALSKGAYSPGLPVTIEVPKSFRIQVAAHPVRLGPSFSRPGSILLPHDRLLYQILADQAAPIVEKKTDHSRSFSHQLAALDSPAMFTPTRTCWSALQSALVKHSQEQGIKYILKIDVANYFGSMNLHTLINVLNDSGYPSELLTRLETLLTSYTSNRSSRGILQGMFPSDLFGNFYMEPIDRFLKDNDVLAARYVDDLYVFIESVEAAETLLRQLIPRLRSYDLVLNEAKCKIIPKNQLHSEEPDLQELFDEAVEEIREQLNDEDFDADYGFQSEWDDDDEEEDDQEEDELSLEATKQLFDSIGIYLGQEENIERFCLPLLAKAESDHALQHVLESFKKRPSMAQIYASYVAKFLKCESVLNSLLALLVDSELTDWQKMWILAALSQADEHNDTSVKIALDILQDANRHETLRAVAAIFVGRYGDHSRRITLQGIYTTSSPYIQSAIYFSSRKWPKVEKQNAKTNWGSHTPLNRLLTIAISKK